MERELRFHGSLGGNASMKASATSMNDNFHSFNENVHILEVPLNVSGLAGKISFQRDTLTLPHVPSSLTEQNQQSPYSFNFGYGYFMFVNFPAAWSFVCHDSVTDIHIYIYSRDPIINQ